MSDGTVKVTATLVGAEKVGLRLRALPTEIHGSVRKAVDRLAVTLKNRVKAGYLHGPRPDRLGVLHGRLTRGINIAETDSPTEILASVGTNVEYGRYWELGFTRRVGAGARGGPRKLEGKALLRYLRLHPPGTREVPPRPFLRPALADLRPTVRDTITEAVAEALR